MHLHILGICGTFMGGLAAIARNAGHTVTGCDANVYPPMSDQLRALGIELTEGWDASQINLKPDVFVVGNYAYMTNSARDSLAVIDISNPNDPVFLAEEQGPTPGTSLDGAYEIDVSGNYAYVGSAGPDSLAVIEITGL